MPVATEVTAVRYEDVSAGVPISVPFPLYEALDAKVYYGIASLVAVYNTDYTISLEDDFDTFTLTPTASLIAKINALIALDATETNYITVRRVLGYTTDATAAAVRYTPFTAREFARTVMRFQQLQEHVNRCISLSPSFVGDEPSIQIAELTANRALIADATGTNVIAGPTASEVESAQAYAVAALQAKVDAVAAAASINTPAITVADEGKILRVNDTGDGYDLDTYSKMPIPVLADANKIPRVNGAGDGYVLDTYSKVPVPSEADAHKEVVVNDDGTGYVLQNKKTRFRQHPRYFENFGDDTSLTEIVAAGSDYVAFPAGDIILPDGTLVVPYWRGDAHSPNVSGGNSKGQLEVVTSTDGGAAWSDPIVIYGNMTNGDPTSCYYVAGGVDSLGRAVIITCVDDGTNVHRPHITRSFDGADWSALTEMTVTGDANETGGTLPVFGRIALTEDAKLLVPMYQGDNNWIGILDDATSETTLNLSLVVNSSSPAYSESVICPITAKHWLVFLRQDGVVNQIPMYRTVNGGTSYAAYADTGLPSGGGYVIQLAFPVEVCGVTHIALLAGVRKTVSGPITGAPGVGLFMAQLSDIDGSGDAVFERVHLWPLADDGEDRDAYIAAFYDPGSDNLGIAIHEETDEFSSRILFGAVSLGDALGGQPIQVRRDIGDLLIEGETLAGSNVYGAQQGWYSKSGPWVDVRFRVNVTTMNSTGNLKVTGFPFLFASDQDFEASVVTGLAGSAVNVTARAISGTDEVELWEREGLSRLLNSETSGTFDIRMNFRARVYKEGT